MVLGIISIPNPIRTILIGIVLILGFVIMITIIILIPHRVIFITILPMVRIIL